MLLLLVVSRCGSGGAGRRVGRGRRGRREGASGRCARIGPGRRLLSSGRRCRHCDCSSCLLLLLLLGIRMDEIVRVEPADGDEKIENFRRLVDVDLDELLGLVLLQEAASEALEDSERTIAHKS